MKLCEDKGLDSRMHQYRHVVNTGAVRSQRSEWLCVLYRAFLNAWSVFLKGASFSRDSGGTVPRAALNGLVTGPGFESLAVPVILPSHFSASLLSLIASLSSPCLSTLSLLLGTPLGVCPHCCHRHHTSTLVNWMFSPVLFLAKPLRSSRHS